jgi:hypothetical protein
MSSSRTRVGKVSKFDPSTWWGEIALATPATPRMEFHATCYLGSSTRSLPRVGDQVEVVFSDESGTRLLSISPCLRGTIAMASVRPTPRKRATRR